MSAVSSVSTLGVLVTVMPRFAAAATSILSTPLPKLAISLRFGPACSIAAASITSVMQGTRTSASFIAAMISGCDMRWSSIFKRASNNSRIRVSTGSGSFRVRTTSGFFLFDISTPFFEQSSKSRFQAFSGAKRGSQFLKIL